MEKFSEIKIDSVDSVDSFPFDDSFIFDDSALSRCLIYSDLFTEGEESLPGMGGIGEEWGDDTDGWRRCFLGGRENGKKTKKGEEGWKDERETK